MARLRLLLGVVISVGCIAALLSQINLALAWSALTRANPLWLLVAMVILAATMFTKIYRWGLLYYPTTGLRLAQPDLGPVHWLHGALVGADARG